MKYQVSGTRRDAHTTIYSYMFLANTGFGIVKGISPTMLEIRPIRYASPAFIWSMVALSACSIRRFLSYSTSAVNQMPQWVRFRIKPRLHKQTATFKD